MHRYSDTLRTIAPILAEHVDGRAILQTLARFERNDAAGFEVAEAVYWIGADWHSGQACPLYAAMCATQFRPGIMSHGPDESVSRDIYAELQEILK